MSCGASLTHLGVLLFPVMSDSHPVDARPDGWEELWRLQLHLRRKTRTWIIHSESIKVLKDHESKMKIVMIVVELMIMTVNHHHYNHHHQSPARGVNPDTHWMGSGCETREEWCIRPLRAVRKHWWTKQALVGYMNLREAVCLLVREYCDGREKWVRKWLHELLWRYWGCQEIPLQALSSRYVSLSLRGISCSFR